MNIESRLTRVSVFGRFADELTRLEVVKPSFSIALKGFDRIPQYKDDGYFVFAGLASPATYNFQTTAAQYQEKAFSFNLPANSTVEVTIPGEDELLVVVTAIDIGQKRVSFDAISFVRPIRKGATVLGPGGFAAVLTEIIEGNNQDFAILDTIVGLSVNDALRIIRSTRMILRPGPYYPFPSGSTLLAVRAVENTLGAEPIDGVGIEITAINAVPLTTIAAGGVNLSVVDLPGPKRVMLGPAAALHARSNSRGDAVFYYPGTSPVTSLTLRFTKTNYVTTTVTSLLTSKQRNFRTVVVPRV